MKKVSKLLVMALIVLAVVSLTSVVKASTKDLINYVRDSHNLNSMLWEIPNDQKNKLEDGIVKGLDDATADSILQDIKAAEDVVLKSGVTDYTKLTTEQQAQIVAYAKSAASKAGCVLDVNLGARTYKLTKNGEIVVQGQLDRDRIIVNPGSGDAATTSGKTLLYTGANYVAYALAAVAIVAVAVVVKKRA